MAVHSNWIGQCHFSATVSASGRVNIKIGNGEVTTSTRLVHVVSVTQPIRSWTVIRDHLDFVALGNVLIEVISGLPTCPPVPLFDFHPSPSDFETIVKARNAIQSWFLNVILYPGCNEIPALRQFLCFGANMVPLQFEGVDWITFTNSKKKKEELNSQIANSCRENNLDELEMDDMFAYEDGGSENLEDDDINDHDYYLFTDRYQPSEEPISHHDIKEIQNHTDDVEMVEDVGSLAQSLGASHLGKSIQMQRQLHGKKHECLSSKTTLNINIHKSLNVGTILSVSGKEEDNVGGIGNAVEKSNNAPQYQARVKGLSDSFNQTKPISPPRLDSFKMIKVIGKGSFGKVFLVREIKSGEMFALKVLRKDNIIKRNQVEHTRTERNVLGYVHHPFIVGLNMAFQSKDKLYFVLDYCAGGELFFHLSKVGKFPEPRAGFYAAEIVLAIEYVHELDIIYRDLKPENVLLDARGHVRLTDFGLSKEGISSCSSGASSFCGTPEYLAPEILNRKGHGRAVDWWSLGALLYEMLSGLPPFYCRDREKLFEKIRKGHLEYPRCLSAKAQALLRGLLTKDPHKRLGSGSQDAGEIMQHTFFSDIDWDKLANGRVPPPWDPPIHGSLDTSQFDDEFTSMPIFSPSSYQNPQGFCTTHRENIFEGFTFTDKGFNGRCKPH